MSERALGATQPSPSIQHRVSQVTAATLLLGAVGWGVYRDIVHDGNAWVALCLVSVTGVIAAAMMLTQNIAGHLFARGFTWAMLSVTLLETSITAGADALTNTEAPSAAVHTALLGLSLAALGRSGLKARPGSAFQPVAFRASLMTGIVLSVFLCVWFSLAALGVATSQKLTDGDWILLAICGGAVLTLGATAAGILRLQLWALLIKGTIDLTIVAGTISLAIVGVPLWVSLVGGAFCLLTLTLDATVLIACVRGTKFRPRSFAALGAFAMPVLALTATAMAIGLVVFNVRF